MASRSKTKTTMAKLNRDRKVLERRYEKELRRAARKQAAAEAGEAGAAGAAAEAGEATVVSPVAETEADAGR